MKERGVHKLSYSSSKIYWTERGSIPSQAGLHQAKKRGRVGWEKRHRRGKHVVVIWLFYCLALLVKVLGRGLCAVWIVSEAARVRLL